MRCLSVLTALALPVALAACAPFAVSNDPDRISLLDSTLKVTFRDGSSCAVDVSKVPAGQLTGCPQDLRYDVNIRHPSVFAKTPVSQFFEPYATVRLTRPADGHVWTYDTPQADTREDNGGVPFWIRHDRDHHR